MKQFALFNASFVRLTKQSSSGECFARHVEGG
jgi:hypothetical protein